MQSSVPLGLGSTSDQTIYIDVSLVSLAHSPSLIVYWPIHTMRQRTVAEYSGGPLDSTDNIQFCNDTLQAVPWINVSRRLPPRRDRYSRRWLDGAVHRPLQFSPKLNRRVPRYCNSLLYHKFTWKPPPSAKISSRLIPFHNVQYTPGRDFWVSRYRLQTIDHSKWESNWTTDSLLRPRFAFQKLVYCGSVQRSTWSLKPNELPLRPLSQFRRQDYRCYSTPTGLNKWLSTRLTRASASLGH